LFGKNTIYVQVASADGLSAVVIVEFVVSRTSIRKLKQQADEEAKGEKGDYVLPHQAGGTLMRSL